MLFSAQEAYSAFKRAITVAVYGSILQSANYPQNMKLKEVMRAHFVFYFERYNRMVYSKRVDSLKPRFLCLQGQLSCDRPPCVWNKKQLLTDSEFHTDQHFH